MIQKNEILEIKEIEKHQLHGRLIFRAFHYFWFPTLIFPLIGIFVGFQDNWRDTWLQTTLVLSLFFALPFAVVPTFLLTFSYLRANKSTSFLYEKESERFTIRDSNQEFTFQFSDIKIIRRVSTIDLKHNSFVWPIPWHNFSYVQIILKDHKDFILTSFIFNTENPPFNVARARVKVKVFPFIPKPYFKEIARAEAKQKKLISKKESKLKNEQVDFRQKVNYFKQRFNSLNEQELNAKLEDKSILKEAKRASEELIKELSRKTKTNQW